MHSPMLAPVPANIYDFQPPITSDTMAERPQMILVRFQRHNGQHPQKFNHSLNSHEDVETMHIIMNNAE